MKIIKLTINKLVQLSIKVDSNNILQNKSSENKFKILIYSIQLLSVLLTDKSRIADNNFILKISEFITLQSIKQVQYQIFALSCILCLHALFFILIISLSLIKNQAINELSRQYISYYDWIIFIPSQMLCFQYSHYIIIIESVIVVLCSVAQFIVSIYFYRDPGFNTNNGRTINITFDLIYLILFETVIFLKLIIFDAYYFLKYLLLYFMILVKILEFLKTNKFTHKDSQTFYQLAIITTFIITVQCMFVELFESAADPYFYTLLLILPLLNFLRILKNKDTFEIEYFHSVYLQFEDPQFKVKAYQLLAFHRQSCNLINCQCKNNIFLIQEEVNKFIIQQLKSQKQFHFIKYISFQVQNNNQGFRNYLQIMEVMKREINFSYYDDLVIQAFLTGVREKTKQFYKEIIKNKFQEVVFSLQWFEQNNSEIQESLIRLLTLKLKLWIAYVTDKIETYQQLQDLSKKISFEIKSIQEILLQFKNEVQFYLNNEISLNENLFYQRICQIFELSSFSVNQYHKYENKIQQIIFHEENQGDLLNYLMFENQQAMQLLVIISKEQRGKIEKISNKWAMFDKCDNLGDLMPLSFIEVHDSMLNNYCKLGPSKNQIFESFIKYGASPIISKVKICINNFPRYDNDFLYLMGTVIKTNSSDAEDYLLIDSDFRVLGYSESLEQKVLRHINYKELLINTSLFDIIPESKVKLIEHYQQMKKLNLNFQTHEKFISYKQQAKLQLGANFPKLVDNHDKNNIPLSPYERLLTIQTIQGVDISQQVEYEFDIMLTISQVCLSYKVDKEDTLFIYYWITFCFQDEKVFESSLKQQYSFEVQQKTMAETKKIPLAKINQSIAQTTSSLQQNSIHILQFHQTLTLIKRISAYKILILISILYIIFYISASVLIYFQMSKKEIQQTLCFDQLGFSTTFLDGYGRAMIASRHVIYMRDFNNFLSSSNSYHIDEGISINATSVDKISFSLYIYRQSVIELISFFQDESEKLKIYYEDDETVDLLRVNYDANESELQTMQSLAEYYQVMIQYFYMAIMSFAKDPTLYLKGTTDTYAQVNTRSILYFNFKRITSITLDFMSSCQSNDKLINSQLDNDFNKLLIISYVIIACQILLFAIIYKVIQRKRKFVLSLFIRTTLHEGIEEIQLINKLIDIVKNSKIWFGIYQDFEGNTRKTPQQYIGKSVKSHIQNHMSSKALWRILISLFLISYVSLLINHTYYLDYSTKLSPIVTAALKTLNIRLLFLNQINNWDVYVNKMFYQSMITIQPTATGRYKLYSENIRHGYQLLLLSNVDEELLKSNLYELQQEPFTDLVYSQSSQFSESVLLSQDICIISDCDMKAHVYQDRIYSNQLDKYYKVGIINLFKSTIQVMNQNDLFNLKDPYEIIATFEKLEKSQEYFLYFLWGFDAILYQNRLFSDYFIELSRNSLQKLTSSLQILFITTTTFSIIFIIIILIVGNWMIEQEFIKTIDVLYQIPKSTIANKQLGKQLRLL